MSRPSCILTVQCGDMKLSTKTKSLIDDYENVTKEFRVFLERMVEQYGGSEAVRDRFAKYVIDIMESHTASKQPPPMLSRPPIRIIKECKDKPEGAKTIYCKCEKSDASFFNEPDNSGGDTFTWEGLGCYSGQYNGGAFHYTRFYFCESCGKRLQDKVNI
jgi:hypothetical protein